MKDLQREILNQVAAGTLTAEEGAARLEALESEPSSAPAAAPAAAASAPAQAVRKVRLISRFGSTEVIGDPNVDGAVADGPHKARQDGDTMVIEQSSPISDETSFEFSRPQRRVIINGFDFGRRLTVRVNPSLPLSATVQAGNLRVRGMQGAISAQVQAGNCVIGEFRGPLDVDVAAGNVDATGKLTEGASTIRCEMGSVRMALDKASSVRISARTTLGKVAIEGDAVKNGAVGGAAGTLDIECNMGNVRVVAG
jgi:hypothetical protein